MDGRSPAGVNPGVASCRIGRQPKSTHRQASVINVTQCHAFNNQITSNLIAEALDDVLHTEQVSQSLLADVGHQP